MPNQDEIDTAPVVMRDDTHVTFESIELSPGDRAELVLSPEKPVRSPVLFVSSTQKDSTVIVEQILHGRTAIFEREGLTLEKLRFGKKVDLTITAEEPIVVVVANPSPLKTTVGASLVTNEPEDDTTYRLTGENIPPDRVFEKKD